VLLMCLGSLIIALCPGFATIGAAAPVLLLVARLVQGISLGGEYGTSSTYLSEVPTQRRGLIVSFQAVTVILGQFAATVLLLALQRLVLTEEEIAAWGWRIPFLVGAACAVFAIVIRRNLTESAQFERTRAERRPMRELLQYRREMAVVAALTLGGVTMFYTFTAYMQKFLVHTTGMVRQDATLISSLSLLCYMAVQPAFGWLSDRIGQRPVLLTFGVLGTLFTVPLLNGLRTTTDPLDAFLCLMAALLIASCYTAVNPLVKADQFPSHIRALGVALPHAVAASVFGGTVEYIAIWCKLQGHEALFFWYIAGCVLVSFLVYATLGRRKRPAPAAMEAAPASV
jgi:MFS transporter, MHS family, alpha-ketoglutarate permease